MADELSCPECGEVRGSRRLLGLHRRSAHGVPGERSHSAASRARGNTADALVWLSAHPGAHHYRDVARAVGVDPTRVVKALSAARVKGVAVTSDGAGNWQFMNGSAPNLPVPVNHKVPIAGEFHRIDGFILLEDAEGGIWLAEQIR